MDNRLMLRSEVPEDFRWSIGDIFASDGEWETAYAEFKGELSAECTQKGHMAEGAHVIRSLLDGYDSQDEKLERLYVYAHMRFYEDMSDSVHQGMAERAAKLSVEFGKKYSFLESELLSVPEEKLRLWMQDELKDYGRFISDILARKPHTLSEGEEAILAGASIMSQAPKNIFSQFNNVDLKFGMVPGGDGTDVRLTLGRFTSLMQSGSRDVRRSAFKELYRGYCAYGNTLAAAYEANVKQSWFYASTRNYASSMEMYLDGNFIPTSVYDSLIDTVNGSLGLLHRYVSLKKKALGVDELHMYDVYAPMVGDYSMKVTYGEAKDIVLKALAPMGQEYIGLLKRGFDEGWVDVYENQGKRSGAYSWGAYGTHPYVSMNYENTLDDVFTLAHEMGHAMHTYYSGKNQPHIYANYRIFVAEVASTCNEVMLIKWLLDNCDDDRRELYLLNHYLEQFRGTLFRQTMFAEFEKLTHGMCQNGEPINLQSLNRIYHGLNEKYFGPDMVVDSEVDQEWSRIPHFYNPFYVYQYATGFSAAIAIANGIMKGNEAVRAGYREFLSGGCMLHPLELLKLCGVDMESGEPVQAAMETFKELLCCMERKLDTAAKEMG